MGDMSPESVRVCYHSHGQTDRHMDLKFGMQIKWKDTLLFIFASFHIINLPTIIAIQFLDGVGENIVKLYRPVYRFTILA